MKTIFFILTLILGLLSTCQSPSSTLKIAAGSEQSTHHIVGEQLSNILNQYAPASYALEKMKPTEDGSKAYAERLVGREVDFALAQNDVEVSTHKGRLRTVLPLYPQLFLIIHQDSIQAESLRELIKDRKIAIGPQTGATRTFTEAFFKKMGIAKDEYTLSFGSYATNTISDSIPISISVTAFNNPRIEEMITQKGGKIWALDEARLKGNGSLADGFCLRYPYAYPFIIPKNTYENYPAKPILTLALDNVLLTYESMDANTVYALVQAVLEHKDLLIKENPSFRFIQDNFERESLQFPLHEGTKQYLDRNKPSFWERYAELLALVLTLLTMGTGAGLSYWKWARDRKKQKIDSYYSNIIQIENEAKELKEVEALQAKIHEMDRLRQKAFEQLANEKLLADDSFRIFITLIQDTTAMIEKKMSNLHK